MFKEKYFFIGIAGSGMSAIAQYLVDRGHSVSGSDRLFGTEPNHQIRQKLEKKGIKTYVQGEAEILPTTSFVVVSTAIESTVPEYQRALELKIPIIHRSEMLKKITEQKKTIAVSGTSGKSSTTAMIFTVLDYNNFSPSMINGSGLVRLQKGGLIGNSHAGSGEWLVIEADESDGTLVNYKPEIGLILNLDRDHKEFDELDKIFTQFVSQSKQIIVNRSNERVRKFSKNSEFDFGTTETEFVAENIEQTMQGISFTVNEQDFFIPVIGLHNVENAMAAISVGSSLGIPLEEISAALETYEGIDRRMQIIYQNKNIAVIDDYAHNPAKISSAIRSCQVLSDKVTAFFQPHGFAPLKFFKDELIETLCSILRKNDEIYFSEVYFAGGTANKTITSEEIINILKEKSVNAKLCNPRENLINQITLKPNENVIILVMGARDPSLGDFSKFIAEKIKNNVV